MAEASVISIDCGSEEPTSKSGTFVGSTVSGVEVCVLDESGRRAYDEAIGEIAVRSESVFSGYWGESSSNEMFCSGFFKTGDIGYLDRVRNLYLMGRARRTINIGGVKVDPREVEQTIEMLSGVSECHVDAVSNASGSEVIRARIAVRSGVQLERRDVIDRCREQLAEYKLPRVIEFVDSLRATISGKMPVHWETGEGV
jgi:acyl-CoA synthetase (AMP-forming)/AMP-acid ligase II